MRTTILLPSLATLLFTGCREVLRRGYPSNRPLEATPHQCIHSPPSTQGAINNFNKCPLDTPLRDLDPLAVHWLPTVDRYASLCIRDDTLPY